jgi:hypothetical protein
MPRRPVLSAPSSRAAEECARAPSGTYGGRLRMATYGILRLRRTYGGS